MLPGDSGKDISDQFHYFGDYKLKNPATKSKFLVLRRKKITINEPMKEALNSQI